MNHDWFVVRSQLVIGGKLYSDIPCCLYPAERARFKSCFKI